MDSVWNAELFGIQDLGSYSILLGMLSWSLREGLVLEK